METSPSGKDESFTPGIYCPYNRTQKEVDLSSVTATGASRGSSPRLGHLPRWFPVCPDPPSFSIVTPAFLSLLHLHHLEILPMYNLPKAIFVAAGVVGFFLFKLHLHTFNKFFTIPTAGFENWSSDSPNTSCSHTSLNSFCLLAAKAFWRDLAQAIKWHDIKYHESTRLQ